MTLKKVAPYGAWESQITTKLIVSESISLGDVLLSDGKNDDSQHFSLSY